ncbi:MAG TPA: ABC transporter ATP-binding protein [Myxococcota bacterium]|nr:ABC transporter ATP-binding protein [Myxococcota bacterium]
MSVPARVAPAGSGPLLEVRDLRVSFASESGDVPAVRGASLAIAPGETLALVGESGSGKSVTALALLRLVAPPGRIVSGEIRFGGRDVLALEPAELQAFRGRDVGMIFQEPMTSLNPVFRIGDQIGEVLRVHRRAGAAEARRAAVELLARVRMPDPERRAVQYPHELSGGMKQRAMIAMALACGPALLVADEPTTALDVTIQAQILELLRSLQRETGMAVLLITHSLGVVARFAQRVAVMYAGEIVEEAPVRDLFAAPAHPYTRALLRALPRPGARGKLAAIEGTVPAPQDLPPGCAFADRCPEALARCAGEPPPVVPVDGRPVRCWLPAAVATR